MIDEHGNDVSKLTEEGWRKVGNHWELDTDRRGPPFPWQVRFGIGPNDVRNFQSRHAANKWAKTVRGRVERRKMWVSY